MASPDHAATVRESLDELELAAPFPSILASEGRAALDALVAALAQAEHERDEARSRLRDAPRGGAGSHWDDCHLSHIDCANVRRERAERQRDELVALEESAAELAEAFRPGDAA